MILALLCLLTYRLLAERSRRKTLIGLCENAPEGTVIVQSRGPGGPEMWMRIGCDTQKTPHAKRVLPSHSRHGRHRSPRSRRD